MQKTPYFNNDNVINSFRNLKKGIQVLTLKNNSNKKNILELRKLGKFDVHCYEPMNQKTKVGVVGPVEFDVTEESVEELLIEQGYVNAKAKRLILGYGEKARKTKTMKVFLEVETLPSHITIMWEKYEVTQYIDKSWQCFNCQEFGHLAKNCKKPPKCVLCAGIHTFSECSKQDIAVKCCNCGQNHTASYGGCIKMKEEKQIQKIKAVNSISYRDAVTQYT